MSSANDAMKPLGPRQLASQQRRQAILEAGLSVFSEKGFAAARLDDVAAQAGVAKGTIYLFFKDKQDLLEQIVLGEIAPVLAALNHLTMRRDLPVDDLLTQFFEVFRREVLNTKRRLIARLVIAEGPRFPDIAAFYHREVVAKGLELVRRSFANAEALGPQRAHHLARFPQLVIAPLILAVIWDGLFAAIDPLDVEGLLAAHRDFLLGAPARKDAPP